MEAIIWTLLGLHVVAATVAAGVGRRLGRAVFAVAAVPAAATAVWAAKRLGGSDAAEAELAWVPELDLELVFRVDTFAALVTVLVAGIGAGVFVYAGGYFGPDSPGLGRFAATLVAFSGSMVGLVWADSVWTLFVFWEATSITSFLLVGHNLTSAKARTAARRALVITAAGGLVLLGGLVPLVDAAGTARLSEMQPTGGVAATAAAVAVMVAAATKSAQVPFHVWLPGAMAAPTPVSAYLHSATMVKAGVLVVALLAPVLGDTSTWEPLGLAFGLVSIVWGAIGALRHHDAKLILAWGTVSQLGLMVALLSLGDPKATFAAVSILVAHALFKASLFMVVGEVDVRTGTRDIREVSGLGRVMPVACAVALLAGASMAGLPPLLGFPAKEAAVEAVLGLSGWRLGVTAAAVFGGSAVTVAYTARLLVGLFAGPAPETAPKPARWGLAAPSVALAVAGLAGFVFAGDVTRWVAAASERIDVDAGTFSLLRWPGPTLALGVSAAIVAAGGLLAVVATVRDRGRSPVALGADLVDAGVDGTVGLARRVAALVQHGSLPLYLTTIATVASLATIPFFWSIDPDAFIGYDNRTQPVLAAAIAAAAVAATVVTSRLGAALALGAVGVGVAGLFVAHGAPDLALTQLLVETVVVVGFVAAIGRLSPGFPPVGRLWRAVRIGVSTLVAVAFGGALASAASAPTGTPPVGELTREAVDEGGGNNIVNVVLTDIRALDTFGEVMVLVVVAVGVLALLRAPRREAST